MVKDVTPSRFKPFMLIKKENDKVIIAAGSTQASPIEFENEEEAEHYLREQPYEMLINLMAIFKYYENEEKKKTKTSRKNDK